MEFTRFEFYLLMNQPGPKFFTKADLSLADLSGADLMGANLSGAILTKANLSEAKYNEYTKWPDGFDTTTAGTIFEARGY